jgi:alginate O-acetyltransferase complex protein AlgI
MLFNSFPFIFLFLPIALVVYFVLNKQRLLTAGKVWLAVASIVFYAYWNVRFVALLFASIGFNYVIGSVLRRMQPGKCQGVRLPGRRQNHPRPGQLQGLHPLLAGRG